MPYLPGRVADFIVLNNLEDLSIAQVYKNGLPFAAKDEKDNNVYPEELLHSVKAPKLSG